MHFRTKMTSKLAQNVFMPIVIFQGDFRLNFAKHDNDWTKFFLSFCNIEMLTHTFDFIEKVHPNLSIRTKTTVNLITLQIPKRLITCPCLDIFFCVTSYLNNRLMSFGQNFSPIL
ncbi:unnamed protein product [Schistosoma mattheei]|uniref:Uncharacterized protein n=1 Tax=Schistosoma mattheei TaxID=31246 RepID=A0A3P8FZZ5_9TREM|nr:unnamed protein product [Schistosoma mattheei]